MLFRSVVISTDTAFLVGALAIIKPVFPARVRLFLLTLAVVDDVGALGVIALFYSDEITWVPLLVAAVLLAALAARPHRVLTRAQLLELAHGRGQNENDRSIDIRVTRLRKKIESDAERPSLIRTVRGEGYMFVPAEG
mgnify:CR=1 FL=1